MQKTTPFRPFLDQKASLEPEFDQRDDPIMIHADAFLHVGAAAGLTLLFLRENETHDSIEVLVITGRSGKAEVSCLGDYRKGD